MAKSDDAVTRAVVASLVNDLYPPIIRDAILSDRSFRDRFEFQVDVRIVFEGTGVKVSRATLFAAVRDAVNRNISTLTIQDSDGLDWIVEVSDPLTATVRLKQANRSLSLPAFWMLFDDANLRLANLGRTASELNLPEKALRNWKQKLTLKPLSDDEVDGLFTELKHLPLHVMSRISTEVVEGASSFDSLAPRSSNYFIRLVGQVDQASNLETFVKAHLRKHFDQLIGWNPKQGLGLAMLLSWHSSIPAEIDVESISDADLESAFEEICKSGDLVSQVGAIELGLSVLDQRAALAAPVEQMIRQMRDDEPNSDRSRFRLLSALGVLVEGEVSRTGVLRGYPPFWRRLAALAQASLVERCMRSAPVDIARFSDLANSGRGELFYLQNLCDLRLEPKWLPDFIAPDQLKAEFLGRIANAAKRSATTLPDSIRRIAVDEGEESIVKQIVFPKPFYPGPLEGGVESEAQLPAELADIIQAELAKDAVDQQSFVALVNSALIFRLDSSFAIQATAALRRVKHFLRPVPNVGSSYALVSGLASVAAATRSPELSDEIRIFVRKSRSVGTLDIAADDLFRIGMVAAASHSQLDDWCTFVGGWVTEIAYSDLLPPEAHRLHAHVKCLCAIEPALWTTLGRAEAALGSLCGWHPE